MYVFTFLPLKERVVEGEVVSELLVIIFYLHSLWLFLSRALFAVWDFFLPFFALKAPPYRKAVSDSSVSEVLSCAQMLWPWRRDGKGVLCEIVMTCTL